MGNRKPFKKSSNALNMLLYLSIVALIVAGVAFGIVSYFTTSREGLTYEKIQERKVNKIEPIMNVTLVKQDSKKAYFDKKLPKDMTGRVGEKSVYKKYFSTSEFKDGKKFILVRTHGTNANGQFYEGYVFARLQSDVEKEDSINGS